MKKSFVRDLCIGIALVICSIVFWNLSDNSSDSGNKILDSLISEAYEDYEYPKDIIDTIEIENSDDLICIYFSNAETIVVSYLEYHNNEYSCTERKSIPPNAIKNSQITVKISGTLLSKNEEQVLLLGVSEQKEDNKYQVNLSGNEFKFYVRTV